MTKKVLSGVAWCAYHNLYKLQRANAVPDYPWDSLEIGNEVFCYNDWAFGGEWKILEQQFVFQWDTHTLIILMRGELPIDPHTEKPIESRGAQRRWFVDKLRIEKPTGKKVGLVKEVTVIEAQSGDDVMKLLGLN